METILCKMEKKWRTSDFLPFIYTILVLVMLCAVFRIPSYGAELNDGESRVFDYAGLFSPEEIAELEEETVRLREELKAEIIVLTIDKAGGWSSQETADEFYFSQGFEKNFDEDGAVVLIDMDNREIYLGTYGIMIRVITDRRLESILDAAYPYAARGDYAAAALTMLKECEMYVQKGIVAGQYNYDAETGKIEVYHTIRWYEALAAFAVSAVTAGFVCFSVAQSYRMKKKDEKSTRLAYQENCNLHLQPSSDQLINTSVHHTVIVRQSTSGRSTGGSSSRRSTTHTHSGHRAGGGGRRF